MSEQADELEKIIDPMIERTLAALGEHCDSVQIFVTKHDPTAGGTVRKSKGCGNWFTRFGQVTAWVEQERGYYLREGERESDANAESLP